jgi:hypothetical protein
MQMIMSRLAGPDSDTKSGEAGPEPRSNMELKCPFSELQCADPIVPNSPAVEAGANAESVIPCSLEEATAV